MPGLGIEVTLVEPGPFATDQGAATNTATTALDAYQPLRDALDGERGLTPADPALAAEALMRVVDATEPPRRVLFGSEGLVESVAGAYAQRVANWRQAGTYFNSSSPAGAEP